MARGKANVLCSAIFVTILGVAAYHVFLATEAYIRSGGRSLTTGLPPCEYPSSLPWRNWTDRLRWCMLDRLGRSDTIWSSVHEVVAACVREPCWKMLDVYMLPNEYDLKFVLLPRYAPNTKECTLVTLGIGNDILSELALQKLLPACKFYGADPNPSVSQEYASVLKGKYFQAAVDGVSGPIEVLTYQKTNSWAYRKGGWWYRRERLPNSTSLVDFLSFNVSQKVIDYLFLDNEGAELGVLEQFAYGESLEKNGIVVCQMSIEFHGRALGTFGLDWGRYSQVIQTLITRSPMLPIWQSPPALHAAHQIAIYINTQHPYCLEKYFSFPR